MQLRFIGIGAAFNPAMGNTSAFFTRGRDLYLIDCGEQVFAGLMAADLLARYDGRLTVVVTHLHADHCGSLATLCLYAHSVLRRAPTIVHPNGDIATLLRLMGVSPAQAVIQPGYDRDGLRMVARPVKHVPGLSAYGYLLTDEEGTVYYGGDSAELPADLPRQLREGTVRHAYLDVSQLDALPEHPAHLPFSALCAQVEPPLRSRVTLMHFNRDFRPLAAREGFAIAEVDPLFQ